MRIIVQLILVLILPNGLVSCSDKHNSSLQLFDNDKLIASIFKSSSREYHVWTKNEIKNSKDALFIRNGLKINKEYVTYFYKDSTLDEGHYYAYYSTFFVRNPSQVFDTKDDGNIYIESGDTITYLSNQGNIYDLYTNRQLGKNDINLLKRALNCFKAFDAETVFLYLANNTGENYYASYNGTTIHNKTTTKEIATNIISELYGGMTIESNGNIIVFLDKIERAKSILNKIDDEVLKKNLRTSLISFQKTNFPKARKAYYHNAKKQLWEKDIEVSMSGKNITFTGYMFTKNQVKKDTYLEIKDEVSKLRFSTVGFRAFEGDDKTYWELNPQKDSEI